MKRAARMLISWAMLAVLIPAAVSVSAIHYGIFLAAEAAHLWIATPIEIGLAAAIGWAWNFGKGNDAKDGDENQQTSETGSQSSRAAEK